MFSPDKSARQLQELMVNIHITFETYLHLE